MNTMSEELNTTQKALTAIQKSRRQALDFWAVSSARISRTIGSDRFAKAASHHRRQRQLSIARRQVEAATAAFLKASEGCSAAMLETLAQNHARQVAEYQAVQ